MECRLGASKSESSLRKFLTLENLAKERRGIRSSRCLLGKAAVSGSFENIKSRPISPWLGGDAMLKMGPITIASLLTISTGSLVALRSLHCA